MTWRYAALAAAVAALVATAVPSSAFEEKAGEKEALKACEASICDIVGKKSPAGKDIACAIGKTWKQDKIQAGIGGRVAWAWGDARCAGEIAVPRALVIEALTKPEVKISLPMHKVSCELERSSGGPAPVVITLAPTLLLKGGEVKKVWVNVKTVEAPSVIKGVIWAVARLENSVGIFHRDMVKGINRFMKEKCKA